MHWENIFFLIDVTDATMTAVIMIWGQKSLHTFTLHHRLKHATRVWQSPTHFLRLRGPLKCMLSHVILTSRNCTAVTKQWWATGCQTDKWLWPGWIKHWRTVAEAGLYLLLSCYTNTVTVMESLLCLDSWALPHVICEVCLNVISRNVQDAFESKFSQNPSHRVS